MLAYLGIENINLNASQKSAFVRALKELALFGGRDASYEEAGREARAYIGANRRKWEEENV